MTSSVINKSTDIRKTVRDLLILGLHHSTYIHIKYTDI